MPADKPFQFSLSSLLLVMAASGPLLLLFVRLTGSPNPLTICSDGLQFGTAYGPLLTGIFCLGASVSTVVVVPILLTIVQTKRWLRRRRRSSLGK